MAKSPLPHHALCLLLLLSFNLCGGMLNLANGEEKTWCVAKPSSSDAELTANMDYACAEVGARGESCKMIQEGGQCFFPNTLISHASIAMNLYYQLMGRNAWNCYFGGTGLLTTTDPSYGSCNCPY